ncbi:DUF2520 domain-containing protein [Marinovum sp.]|uniref:Rossmann-like and DUF2520 domain-containing protein n=1 Tax=Marinovum sp. TaxID=2024839 RepID=UPI002B272884|nr:DUF2520 domain-containing protein [Marinovum sp.]
MTPPLRITVIGPGKVGQTLLRLCHKSAGLAVGDILARRPEAAAAARDFAGGGRAIHSVTELRPADLFLLTVPDDHLAGVAETLAGQNLPPAIAAHCSGFHPASLLAPLAAAGWQTGSAHPVLSFADPAAAVAQFAGCYCGVEGAASETLEAVFAKFGARCFPIRSEAKALYHAGAVISNNFTTVLQALAQEAWEAAGVPPEARRALHAALLRSTVENVLAQGPQAALTGPAARGDSTVVAAQGAALRAWHPEAGALYDGLSALARRLKTEGRTGSGQDRQPDPDRQDRERGGDQHR